MTNVQFRLLYREFLFRIVDLELLAPHRGHEQASGPVRRPAGYRQLVGDAPHCRRRRRPGRPI